MHIPDSTDIIKHVPIDNLLAKYEELKEKFIGICDSVKFMEKEIDLLMGDHFRFLDHNLTHIAYGSEFHLRKLKRGFWRYTFDKLQIYNLMSEKKKNELDAQLESENTPDFTHENILTTFKVLIENVRSLMDDTILEAFNILRPPGSGYKTNTEFEVGKKAIIGWVIDCSKWQGKYQRPSLNYRKEQTLRSLDNAFSLMDGCGPIKYPGDSVSRLKAAISENVQIVETKYFKSDTGFPVTVIIFS